MPATYPPLPANAATKRSKPVKMCMLSATLDEVVTSRAEALINAGHVVTILCIDKTGHPPQNAKIEMLPSYEEFNIRAPNYIRRPYEAYLWLKDKSFDIIHYSEQSGLGHYLGIAKRQGLAFASTLLCANAVGPSLQATQAKGLFPKSVNDLGIGFMERESVTSADILIASDANIPGWMAEQGWNLPKQTYLTSKSDLKPWIEWHDHLPEVKVESQKLAIFTKKTAPLVSICICHHNRPVFLKQALASVEVQDYPNFEVVLVDDGSTEPSACAYLDELEPIFRKNKWQLIRQKNLYQGAATNNAVKHARGEYIKLMDDDDIAQPSELSTFVRIAETTGADILTCFIDTFHGDTAPQPHQKPDNRYLFIGPAVAVGMFQNGFGGNNALMRRDMFMSLGGYVEDYGVGQTDWEFFARAALKGYSLEVIPEPLFWCRKTGDSMQQTTHSHKNSLLSLRPYLAEVRPELQQALLLAFGMSQKSKSSA